MAGIASTVLTILFALASSLCLFYLLYLLAKEKGTLYAVLGFLFPPYPYVWGWLNGSRLQIFDVMAFWTFVTIASVVFPLAMGLTATVNAQPTAPVVSPVQSRVNVRGSLSGGQQVDGQLDDPFAVDEWSFAGQAGDRVTIRCWAAPGSDTDPKVTVLDPEGNQIAWNDDGGEGRAALIADLSLPSSGRYRVQVGVWGPGPYVLSLQ